MNDITVIHLTLSTADDEMNLFSGEVSEEHGADDAERDLPDGTYRVIDGQLVRIVRGVPPQV